MHFDSMHFESCGLFHSNSGRLYKVEHETAHAVDASVGSPRICMHILGRRLFLPDGSSPRISRKANHCSPQYCKVVHEMIHASDASVAPIGTLHATLETAALPA